MSRGIRDVLLGLALTLVAFAALVWQLERSGALRAADARAHLAGEAPAAPPRLLCPLHADVPRAFVDARR